MLKFNLCFISLLIVFIPDQQWLIDRMRGFDNPVYNMLAEKSISLTNDRDYNKTYELVKSKILQGGTHAFVETINAITGKGRTKERIGMTELAEKYGTHWFKSSETVLSEDPFANWMVRKKWPLKEILILHKLHFQQVGFINSSINL